MHLVSIAILHNDIHHRFLFILIAAVMSLYPVCVNGFVCVKLEKFKVANADVGFGSATTALEQALERTRANIKWVAENQDDIRDWFKQHA